MSAYDKTIDLVISWLIFFIMMVVVSTIAGTMIGIGIKMAQWVLK